MASEENNTVEGRKIKEFKKKVQTISRLVIMLGGVILFVVITLEIEMNSLVRFLLIIFAGLFVIGGGIMSVARTEVLTGEWRRMTPEEQDAFLGEKKAQVLERKKLLEERRRSSK